VFNNGDYVRLLIAPNTRIGTIEGSKTGRGRLHYLFRQDKRVSGEKDTPDFYLLESELEACEPPTETEVAAMNRKIERGS
jgi:hypothetical protein